jgi:phage tail sheath gpL-like
VAIDFAEVLSDERVPGVYHEFDDSQALTGLAGQQFRALILAQLLSTGSATPDVPVSLSTATAAASLFGAGSMAARLVARFRAINRSTDLDVIPIDDPSAGVQAVGTITFSGTSAGGTLYLYVAGTLVQVLASGTLAQIAQACTDAINADTTLPVTAVVNGGQPEQVIVTCKHAGLLGNAIDMRLSVNGEAEPSGLTSTLVQLTGGTGTPDLTAAIAAMGDTHYNTIVFPWADTSSLDTIETELASRDNANRQIEGVAFSAVSDAVATLQALGQARNSQFMCILGLPSFAGWDPEVAAEVAAHVAFEAEQNPSRPFTSLPLHSRPAPTSARFTKTERNSLLNDGISTTRVIANQLQIERLVTTRRLNDQGQADNTWFNVNLPFQLGRFRFEWNARMSTRFNRYILAPDTTVFDPGLKVASPNLVRAESNALYATLMRTLALVSDPQGFDSKSIYEIDANDPSRLNARLSPYINGQLYVIAAQTVFRLQ